MRSSIRWDAAVSRDTADAGAPAAVRSSPGIVTEISEDGGAFQPHIDGCFLAVDDLERIVYTNALVGGWRPAEHPLMTAIITMRDHALGTEYVAHVMHRNRADREQHEALGFYDGWGTVTEQLARLAERRASRPRLTEVDAR
jgi:uncharacterized protein YndB with AHSA1/START domain